MKNKATLLFKTVGGATFTSGWIMAVIKQILLISTSKTDGEKD